MVLRERVRDYHSAALLIIKEKAQTRSSKREGEKYLNLDWLAIEPTFITES